MFGIVKFNDQHSDPQFINRTEHFHGGSSTQSLACDSCRAKKVRCTWGRDGCTKCESAGKACNYRAAQTSGGRQKRNSHRSKISHRGESSTVHAQTTSASPDSILSLISPPAKLSSPEQSPVYPLSSNNLETAGGSRFISSALDQAMLSGGAEEQSAWSENFHSTVESRSQERGGEAVPDHIMNNEYNMDDCDLDRIFTDTDYFIRDSDSYVSIAREPIAPGFNLSERSEAGDKCQCLGRIVTLLDDLDTRLGTNIAYSTTSDVLLSFVKASISKARRIIICKGCRSSTEITALLTHVCEKLARLMESIALPFLQGQLTAKSMIRHGAEEQRNQSEDSDSSAIVLCGGYPADATEWESVIRTLALLQLQALWELITKLRRLAPRQHFIRLQSTEARTQSLLRRLRNRISETP
ncbi:hypothetical protein F4679DRAFT_374906 [Xylaria curta]|nr:hypothetical protein F4679DRAFT_374906 [Xylaria curta]